MSTDIKASEVKAGMDINWGRKWYPVVEIRPTFIDGGTDMGCVPGQMLWIGNKDSMTISNEMIVRVRVGYRPDIISDCAPYQPDDDTPTCGYPKAESALGDHTDTTQSTYSPLVGFNVKADGDIIEPLWFDMNSMQIVKDDGSPLWHGDLDSTDL